MSLVSSFFGSQYSCMAKYGCDTLNPCICVYVYYRPMYVCYEYIHILLVKGLYFITPP